MAKYVVLTERGLDAPGDDAASLMRMLEPDRCSPTQDMDRARWLILAASPQAAFVVGQSVEWMETAMHNLTSVAAGTPLFAVGRHQPVDRALLIECGADAYVNPSDGPDYLRAVISAANRKALDPAGLKTSRYFVSDGLTLDLRRRKCTLAGQPVALSSTEASLLATLMARAPEVVGTDLLNRTLWPQESRRDHNSLRIQVNRLRVKLGDDAREPRFIRSVRNHGYIFLPQVMETTDDAGLERDISPLPNGLFRNMCRGFLENIDAADDQQYFQKVIDGLIDFEVCDAGALGLIDEKNLNRLRIWAHAGLSPSWYQEVSEYVPLNNRDFISGETLRLGAVTYTTMDDRCARRFPATWRLLQREGGSAFLSVPLGVRGEVWGALGCLRRGQKFGYVNAATLEMVAEVISLRLASRMPDRIATPI